MGNPVPEFHALFPVDLRQRKKAVQAQPLVIVHRHFAIVARKEVPDTMTVVMVCRQSGAVRLIEPVIVEVHRRDAGLAVQCDADPEVHCGADPEVQCDADPEALRHEGVYPVVR